MPNDDQVDPRRVRIGLGMLAVVIVVCLLLARQVDAAGPRLVLGGIALFTLVRLFLLMRSVRKG